MSRNYTLEDVETLRSKAGVSYEDAVSLLDKYDGDVARALIELEKRGQLNQSAQSRKFTLEEGCEWLKAMWRKGMTTRVLVERKGERLINLSVLFLVLMLILGPYAVIAALVLMLISSCNVSILTEDKKEQTILRGDDEKEEEPSAADIEPAITPDEPAAEKKDDDDFPSITIS